MIIRRPRSEVKSKFEFVFDVPSMSDDGKIALALASARPVAVETPRAHTLCFGS